MPIDNPTRAIIRAAVSRIEMKGRWSVKHDNAAQAVIVAELGPLAGQYRTRLSAHLRRMDIRGATSAALRDVGVC